MANLRRSRLSPSGLQEAPAPSPRRARWPWVAGGAALLLLGLALAWFDGGEEPLRPIAEDVVLPEQGL